MIQARHPTVVVVGTGMAGARVVEELLVRAPERFSIRMFGDEPNGTYNRILLSGVLGGFVDPQQLWINPLEWYEARGVRVHAGVRAERIDRHACRVSDASGKVVEPYDHLILSTGSRPFVPPIEGTRQAGVFVFRTLQDCAAIGTFARQCDRAIVIGGGLLGLEAARGLLSHEVEVTVIETAPHLMPQQLDAPGASLLKHKMEQMGVQVLPGKQIAALTGDGQVSGVRFVDGSTLAADMVILSCGIRPNVDEARAAGLLVDRGIVVDDQLRTSDPNIYAIGECAQHRKVCHGTVEPLYEQAKVLADVLTGANERAAYRGSKVSTTLKVMGIDLTAMGDVRGEGPGTEVVSHLDPEMGVYRKLVVRDNRLVGAVLLGTHDPGGLFRRLFKEDEPLPGTTLELLAGGTNPLAVTANDDLAGLPDGAQICNCNAVCKGAIVAAIKAGCTSVTALGEKTRAGTGCGTCQPVLHELIQAHAGKKAPARPNPIELLKTEKDGLDALDDILRLAPTNNWPEMSEDDKQRAKWYGLFFRKQTPGHLMLRLRLNAGRTNARQLRVIADLSDEFGRGFADLTTRQQIQLRWFTLADVPEIWRRLEAVGLGSMQTGLDNVRGICGCPLGGVTPHELVDATRVIDEFNEMLVGNREFTNLPRKFNVTITGCLENCCHAETQDIGLVPAYRELDGRQVNGFNVLVGGKQGSGGYTPAQPLDVFVRPQEAATVCAEITRIFRDHGYRTQRTRARLAFLIEDRGIAWLRNELETRLLAACRTRLLRAGTDLRKPHHTDHLGIHPQKGEDRYSAGLLVPVGRITTRQLRGVADLAVRYGDGGVRLSVQQNLILTGIPGKRVGAFTEEPLLRELPHDPSPIMRGLVSCTGNDYCHLALIETKGWALDVARELERRTAGMKIAPLTIHWSGCSAGCGMHGVSTIGLQGCRSRVNGVVVDAAHVSVKGQTGPQAVVGPDLMYDVPCDQLADALLPLVKHLPRK